MGKTFRIPTNLASGCFFLLLGAALWFLIPGQIRVMVSVGKVNAQFIPKILAALIAASGLVQLTKSLVLKKEDFVVVEMGAETFRLVFIAMLVAYTVVMDYIGFCLSSVLFALAYLLVFGCRKRSYYFVTLLCVLVVFVVFKYLLRVGFASAWGI